MSETLLHAHHSEYRLVEIRGNIRICAECRTPLLTPPPEYSLPQLDQNFCLTRIEDYYFINKSTHYYDVNLNGNRYYHINPNCARNFSAIEIDRGRVRNITQDNIDEVIARFPEDEVNVIF